MVQDNDAMDSNSSRQSENPKRLKTLASIVNTSKGNILIHQFVLDNSYPNSSGSESYITAVLRSMSGVPANVLNAVNGEGYTALGLAVMKNNPLMVRKLLSCLANIDVNAPCRRMRCRLDQKYSALHLATELNHVSVIQALLDEGADINVRNHHHETILSYAAWLGRSDVAKLLVNEGASVNPEECHKSLHSPLCRAVHSGNLEAVEFFISSGADVNPRQGWSPLCSAVRSGSLAIVEFLVNHGADVNAQEGAGCRDTPLHAAVKCICLAISEFLVGNRADVNAVNRHFTYSGSLEFVEYLVGQGADVNAGDKKGETPLHYAAYGKCLECAAFLLDQGADMRADFDGRTPLHAAASKSSAQMIRLLLGKGANINAKDNRGKTPFDTARKHGNQSGM